MNICCLIQPFRLQILSTALKSVRSVKSIFTTIAVWNVYRFISFNDTTPLYYILLSVAIALFLHCDVGTLAFHSQMSIYKRLF